MASGSPLDSAYSMVGAYQKHLSEVDREVSTGTLSADQLEKLKGEEEAIYNATKDKISELISSAKTTDASNLSKLSASLSGMDDGYKKTLEKIEQQTKKMRPSAGSVKETKESSPAHRAPVKLNLAQQRKRVLDAYSLIGSYHTQLRELHIQASSGTLSLAELGSIESQAQALYESTKKKIDELIKDAPEALEEDKETFSANFAGLDIGHAKIMEKIRLERKKIGSPPADVEETKESSPAGRVDSTSILAQKSLRTLLKKIETEYNELKKMSENCASEIARRGLSGDESWLKIKSSLDSSLKELEELYRSVERELADPAIKSKTPTIIRAYNLYAHINTSLFSIIYNQIYPRLGDLEESLRRSGSLDKASVEKYRKIKNTYNGLITQFNSFINYNIDNINKLATHDPGFIKLQKELDNMDNPECVYLYILLLQSRFGTVDMGGLDKLFSAFIDRLDETPLTNWQSDQLLVVAKKFIYEIPLYYPKDLERNPNAPRFYRIGIELCKLAASRGDQEAFNVLSDVYSGRWAKTHRGTIIPLTSEEMERFAMICAAKERGE